MKNVVLGIAGVVAVAVVGLLAVASMQPDKLEIERSIVVAATPADVFPYANEFDKWMMWNPWRELDPTQKETFSENNSGVGAWYAWKGNENVGSGKMTVTAVEQDRKVVHDLQFIEPFESKAVVTFTMTPEGDGTKVSWGFTSDNDLMGKMFGLFVDMESMLGADFDRGLNKLKPLAEGAAKSRMEAEAAAAAAAPVEGAVVADAAAPADGATPPAEGAAAK
jgi:uncharacterized protein YndB with AHSA1/START domain